MKFSVLTSLFLLAFFTIHAQTDADVEIGVIEKLDTYIPMDAMLVDEHGDTVIIGDLIDKPTILNFVYFRCPGICSPLMDGLADGSVVIDLVGGSPTNRSPVEPVLSCTFLTDPSFVRDGVTISRRCTGVYR